MTQPIYAAETFLIAVQNKYRRFIQFEWKEMFCVPSEKPL